MENVICEVIKNENLNKDHLLLEFENNFKEDFYPGNFVHIKIEKCFLRRPFSVARFNKKSIQIIYKVVGKGTEILSQKTKGESIDIIGPLGNSFPIYKNKKICIIGGGTGIAPLIFLSEELKKFNKEIFFFYGSRNRNSIFFSVLPDGIDYIFSTDDGSFGTKGNIFDIFKKFNGFEVIYGSGPEELLKKISKFSKKVPVYLSLENYMACGMGLCYGCVVKIREKDNWEYKRVCKDGPVFRADKIIWR
ncbi:MAG: dihydroorotate dehydrogenase electron transfer subunit [Candidatus Omnitrophica bacterium]|nr:dihydroorotate dehydrogenase electron transfer subunit [Candidatus Omnitrophota bacterium]